MSKRNPSPEAPLENRDPEIIRRLKKLEKENEELRKTKTSADGRKLTIQPTPYNFR